LEHDFNRNEAGTSMSARFKSTCAVNVAAVVLLLAGGQGDVDGDDATASTSVESSTGQEEGFFSMEVAAADICPEAGEIASLPAGGNFSPELETDEDVLVSGAEGVETRLTCSYGIGVVLPTETDPDDREALRAAMGEFAMLATERLPMAED
jgi:hypothetical protein